MCINRSHDYCRQLYIAQHSVIDGLPLLQIKELEGKQAELLRRRNMAQKELVDAEAKVCKL